MVSAAEETGAILTGVIDTLDAVRRCLAQDATQALEEHQESLAALHGTSDTEMRQLLAAGAELRQALADALALVDKAVSYIQNHRTVIMGAISGSPSASSSEKPGVENRHGDSYPAAGAGLTTELPKRVVPRTQTRTTGVTRLAGKVLPPMDSGHDQVWSEAVDRQLAKIGMSSTFLNKHVEMKIAAMMIDTRMKSAEVAINYTPCGVERQKTWPDTCDKVLPQFLPKGYVLTVYGTSQENEPFQRVYRGECP